MLHPLRKHQGSFRHLEASCYPPHSKKGIHPWACPFRSSTKVHSNQTCSWSITIKGEQHWVKRRLQSDFGRSCRIPYKRWSCCSEFHEVPLYAKVCPFQKSSMCHGRCQSGSVTNQRTSLQGKRDCYVQQSSAPAFPSTDWKKRSISTKEATIALSKSTHLKQAKQP